MAGRTPLACLLVLSALVAACIFGTASASAGNSCVQSFTPCQGSIELTASGTSYGNAGTQGDYSYSVYNSGAYDVTDVSVGDTACSPVSASDDDGTLSPGETWHYSCSTTLSGNPGDVIQHDV